ncbi:hypothetical protein PUN28_005295 [Cardiocondyla obscurior]|uniref:Uncharacterized protein n=1 Tax=Cardiocondyla obscurior TaxID=286306 RepID=A0AAW2GJ26_9HYME
MAALVALNKMARREAVKFQPLGPNILSFILCGWNSHFRASLEDCDILYGRTSTQLHPHCCQRKCRNSHRHNSRTPPKLMQIEEF